MIPEFKRRIWETEEMNDKQDYVESYYLSNHSARSCYGDRKDFQKYYDAASIIHMHEDDMKKAGIMANTNVRVTSKDGTIVVKAVRTREDVVPGLAMLPMGPWQMHLSLHIPTPPENPALRDFL